MSRIASVMFLALEAPVTAFAGVYALVSPLPFFAAILPPSLLEAASSSGTAAEALGLAVQVYGLVLVLLALAEFGIFMIKGQVASKKVLLLAMLLADVLHVGVFLRPWFLSKDGQLVNIPEFVATWGDREWVGFSTNVPLVMLFMLMRILYMATATEPVEKQGRKQGKQH